MSSDFRSEFAGDHCSQGPSPACRLLLRRVWPPFGLARLQQPVSSRSPQTPRSRQFRPLGLRHGQSRQGSLLHHPGLSNGVPRYKRGARGGVPLPRMQRAHVHCVWRASSRRNDVQYAPQLQGNRRWSWWLGAARPQEPKSMPRLSEPCGEDIGLQQDALHSLPHCLLLAVHPAVRLRGSLLSSPEWGTRRGLYVRGFAAISPINVGTSRPAMPADSFLTPQKQGCRIRSWQHITIIKGKKEKEKKKEVKTSSRIIIDSLRGHWSVNTNTQSFFPTAIRAWNH